MSHCGKYFVEQFLFNPGTFIGEQFMKNEGKHPLDDFSPHIEAIVLHVLGICN